MLIIPVGFLLGRHDWPRLVKVAVIRFLKVADHAPRLDVAVCLGTHSGLVSGLASGLGSGLGSVLLVTEQEWASL